MENGAVTCFANCRMIKHDFRVPTTDLGRAEPVATLHPACPQWPVT